jgi:hypothetical protein
MKKLLSTAALLVACGDPGSGGGDNEQEVITTVQLTFMAAGGLPIVAEFDDPDGDGGAPGTGEPISLTAATSYTLTVAFINRLGTIPEDITLEVEDEGAEHQVFFTGSAVAGPATSNPTAPLTHSYADMDANGLPLGLTNTIVTGAGTGTLTVTLRHMPPEAPPEKSADTAAQVKAGGFTAIGGTTDAMVDFTVTVQ